MDISNFVIHLAYLTPIFIAASLLFAFSASESYFRIIGIFPVMDAFKYLTAFFAAADEFCIPFAPIPFMFGWFAWFHACSSL